ncbi:TPA: glycosyltransferase family 4 protein [Proteus mirabilis]
MNIAIVVPSLRKTAPVNIAISIYKDIKNYCNVEATLFYLDKIKNIENNINDIPEAILLNRKNYKLLKNFDIVHSHGLRPDIINFLYAKKKSRVTTLHSMIIKDLISRYGIKGFLISYVWIFILIFFNKRVSISNSVKKHLIKKKISSIVIYNGIKFDNFNIKNDKKYLEINYYINSIKKNKIVVGTISHIEKIKGIEQLIELAKLNEDIFLVIIGDGTYKHKIEKLVSLYNLKNRVLFTGHINHNAQYYSKLFDVYVQPSINEGFGLSVIEAVCNKIPVVCSNIEVFTELFNKQQIDFFQLNDINSLNNSIKRATAKNTTELETIANAIKDRFSVSTMSKSYINLYETIIKNER